MSGIGRGRWPSTSCAPDLRMKSSDCLTSSGRTIVIGGGACSGWPVRPAQDLFPARLALHDEQPGDSVCLRVLVAGGLTKELGGDFGDAVGHRLVEFVFVILPESLERPAEHVGDILLRKTGLRQARHAPTEVVGG